MYNKDEIYNDLGRLNKKLQELGYNLDLQIVGGAALILNDIYSIQTEDIDVISRIENEIKTICDDYLLDINDDALDYIKNFDDCEFITDNRSFSNITIRYLSLGSVIKTKMMNCQDEDKMEKLRFLLEEELEIEMTVEGISNYLIELGETPIEEDIINFLKEIEYI